VGRLLDQFQPDVLHTHGYRADLLHGWRARQLGVATVTTVHGKSQMGRVSNLLEWVHERSLNRSDAVVSVSAPLADSLRRVGVSPDRIHAVPNALVQTDPPLLPAEARRLLGLPRSGFVIGWVGRLVSVKGCDVFIRALSHMADLDWTAVVIGDGPERTNVERLAQQLDIGSKVLFLGEVSDAGRCFSAFDLFVLSSRSEGTPMTLLEAMAAECPVVAAAVGGVPDVMRAPHEGWLVPPDDPTALAEEILCALRQPIGRRARAARALQRTAADYSPDTWIRRHEHVYRTAIAVRAGAQTRNRGSIL
jgi:glycosyltransferase involved in cell wall biosynthesis